MKILISIVSLLAPLHVFAYSCNGDERIAVWYHISNESEYRIILDFDAASYGNNPDGNRINIAPNKISVFDYGCSQALLEGYETRATLRSHENEAVLDLAFLYIDINYNKTGRFSYNAYSIKSPECSCDIGVGSSWYSMDFHDCSSYPGPVEANVEVRIHCK